MIEYEVDGCPNDWRTTKSCWLVGILNNHMAQKPPKERSVDYIKHSR